MKNILIVALNTDWTGISRLPSGLRRAGFEVNALCPRKSYLAKTKYLNASLLYPTFTYSRSKIIYLLILAAIIYFGPDLIVPGDEDAILALHRLANALSGIPFLNKISVLIRKSLTPRDCDSLILSKSHFQGKCVEWGLRSPDNIVVDDFASARAAALRLGYPLALKKDTGYGGSGVSICQSEDDLKRQFHQDVSVPLLTKVKATVKNLLFVSIFSKDSTISLQKFIKGPVGQSPFCAFNGEVFAFNPMVRLRTYPGSTGPASVSSGFQNEDIEGFVVKVARELRYTGFGSLEYIVEEATGLIYIIELNPRPTPTCHIAQSVTTYDLCDMFYRGLNSLPLEKRSFRPYTIAMFPGEKRRDPNSPFLTEGHHDVPHDDAILLQALSSK